MWNKLNYFLKKSHKCNLRHILFENCLGVLFVLCFYYRWSCHWTQPITHHLCTSISRGIPSSHWVISVHIHTPLHTVGLERTCRTHNSAVTSAHNGWFPARGTFGMTIQPVLPLGNWKGQIFRLLHICWQIFHVKTFQVCILSIQLRWFFKF